MTVVRNILFALVFSLAGLLVTAGGASAQSIDAYKAQGLVGEQADGYLGLVKPASPEIERLIDSINLQRKAHYREIAGKNNTSLRAVEAIAGKELIERAGPGQFVRDANGNWLKK